MSINMEQTIKSILKESISVQEMLCEQSITTIAKLAELAINCLKKKGKVILFGNGGSAADSQHIAAELVGRFNQERKALPAIALTCNSSNLTSIGNDYGFEQIFARQIEGLGQETDLAIGISTSGKSANVLAGLSKAKEMGMYTAALIGTESTPIAKVVDVLVSVPSKNTARIQEAHITIGHIICNLIEKAILISK
jgi:D-sedoheptulose 7-phosphate isomerase